jgi:hypothetical protein
MRKLVLISIILLLFLPLPGLAESAEVTSNDLIENAFALDSQTVVYTGEVIGDVMKRGDYTWLNISDGSNTIGVWVATSLVEANAMPGRYNEHGDEVRITGVFHRACAQHGGDMDIHAEQLALVRSAYSVSHAVTPWMVGLALLFTAADGFIAVRLFRKRSGSARVFRATES